MDGIRAVGFDLDGTFMRTRVDYARLNAADRRVCLAPGANEGVHEAVPFPGSVEALGIIKSKGLKVGLLTRGSREYALSALGPIADEFDFVMGRDYSHYDNAKPSPVAMREFAAELGVEPSEILYVGDNVTDWYSARDAGARFAGVLTGSGSRELWNSEDPSIPVLERAGDVVSLL